MENIFSMDWKIKFLKVSPSVFAENEDEARANSIRALKSSNLEMLNIYLKTVNPFSG